MECQANCRTCKNDPCAFDDDPPPKYTTIYSKPPINDAVIARPEYYDAPEWKGIQMMRGRVAAEGTAGRPAINV